MEPPSIETVYQAVYTLFKDSNVTEKEKASLWLGEFQKSVSLTINLQCLPPVLNTKVYFFLLTTS